MSVLRVPRAVWPSRKATIYRKLDDLRKSPPGRWVEVAKYGAFREGEEVAARLRTGEMRSPDGEFEYLTWQVGAGGGWALLAKFEYEGIRLADLDGARVVVISASNR